MMKNRIFKLFLIAILSSCTSENVLDEPIIPSQPEKTEVGLDRNTTILDSSDALTVAQIYFDTNKSRGDYKIVQEVVPVLDEYGKTAFYAVNYLDGFTLISAITDLPPILADVEHGTFSLSDEKLSDNVIIQQLIDNTQAARTGHLDENYKQLWAPYYKKEKCSPSEIIKSRESVGTDAWIVQSELIMELEAQGYEIFHWRKLEEEQDDIPYDIIARFQDDLDETDDAWEGRAQNVYNTAIIAKGQTQGFHNSKVLLSTSWGQGEPYNSKIPGLPLGCTTIAVGQIMRYYQHPSTFNWSAMPDKMGRYDRNEDLENFLYTIRQKIGVNDKGSATIDDSERTLKGYGYSVQQKSHTNSNLTYLPLLCRGATNAANANGHEWICDGYSTGYNQTDYKLFILDNAYYPKFKFIEIDATYTYSSYSLNHINWGWDGKYNGLYLDSNLSVPNLGIYKYNRRDLIISL